MPVQIANIGYRKGLSRKLGYGKIAAFFLRFPTYRGDRSASPPGFSASYFSRNFPDLGTTIYRAPSITRLLYAKGHPNHEAVSPSAMNIPNKQPDAKRRVLYTVPVSGLGSCNVSFANGLKGRGCSK
jgi:hypothetical protein